MTAGHETMRRLALLAAALGAAALLLGACADTGSLPEKISPGATTTWTTLTGMGGDLATCGSGCHSDAGAASANSLSLAADAYAGLSGTSTACPGALFVTKGDETKSSLFLVLSKSSACTGTLTTMTSIVSADGPTLAPVIGAWIQAGAPQ